MDTEQLLVADIMTIDPVVVVSADGLRAGGLYPRIAQLRPCRAVASVLALEPAA